MALWTESRAWLGTMVADIWQAPDLMEPCVYGTLLRRKIPLFSWATAVGSVRSGGTRKPTMWRAQESIAWCDFGTRHSGNRWHRSPVTQNGSRPSLGISMVDASRVREMMVLYDCGIP